MNELVCNYALVRFLPYRETGEFVNVGVVLYAPEVNHFSFQLTEKRNRRAKAFFPELDPKLYAAAIDSLGRELERLRARFTSMAMLPDKDNALDGGLTLFRSMLRRRESLLHFAEPGMRLGLPQQTLDALYGDYVLRNFAQVQTYQETVMRTRLSRWLKEWGLRKRYETDRTVGDSSYQVRLPFVHFNGTAAMVAIKPVDLNRGEPTDVYDHGGMWVQRFKRLSDRGHLPKRTIVPIQFPTGPIRTAAEDVVRELQEIGVLSPDIEDVARLKELAQV